MSDVRGNYKEEKLKELFVKYLDNNLWSSKRIKHLMLPLLVESDGIVTREELKRKFIEVGGELGGNDAKQAGIFIALISNQLGQKKKDYLRQIIIYDYPNNPWEKDNFRIDEKYKVLVSDVLKQIKSDVI